MRGTTCAFKEKVGKGEFTRGSRSGKKKKHPWAALRKEDPLRRLPGKKVSSMPMHGQRGPPAGLDEGGGKKGKRLNYPARLGGREKKKRGVTNQAMVDPEKGGKEVWHWTPKLIVAQRTQMHDQPLRKAEAHRLRLGTGDKRHHLPVGGRKNKTKGILVADESRTP